MLCKFMARRPDVLTDKPHHRFLRKILSDKVWIIRRWLRVKKQNKTKRKQNQTKKYKRYQNTKKYPEMIISL